MGAMMRRARVSCGKASGVARSFLRRSLPTAGSARLPNQGICRRKLRGVCARRIFVTIQPLIDQAPNREERHRPAGKTVVPFATSGGSGMGDSSFLRSRGCVSPMDHLAVDRENGAEAQCGEEMSPVARTPSRPESGLRKK